MEKEKMTFEQFAIKYATDYIRNKFAKGDDLNCSACPFQKECEMFTEVAFFNNSKQPSCESIIRTFVNIEW